MRGETASLSRPLASRTVNGADAAIIIGSVPIAVGGGGGLFYLGRQIGRNREEMEGLSDSVTALREAVGAQVAGLRGEWSAAVEATQAQIERRFRPVDDFFAWLAREGFRSMQAKDRGGDEERPNR